MVLYVNIITKKELKAEMPLSVRNPQSRPLMVGWSTFQGLDGYMPFPSTSQGRS